MLLTFLARIPRWLFFASIALSLRILSHLGIFELKYWITSEKHAINILRRKSRKKSDVYAGTCHCVLRSPFEPSQNTLCDAVPYFLLVEMISRLPLSCLRPSLLKQSVRSVNATVAAFTRCRGSNISKGWLETDQTVSYILAQENISRTSESRVGVTSQMKIWSALFIFEMDQSCRLEQFESGPKLFFGPKSHLWSISNTWFWTPSNTFLGTN